MLFRGGSKILLLLLNLFLLNLASKPHSFLPSFLLHMSLRDILMNKLVCDDEGSNPDKRPQQKHHHIHDLIGITMNCVLQSRLEEVNSSHPSHSHLVFHWENCSIRSDPEERESIVFSSRLSYTVLVCCCIRLIFLVLFGYRIRWESNQVCKSCEKKHTNTLTSLCFIIKLSRSGLLMARMCGLKEECVKRNKDLPLINESKVALQLLLTAFNCRVSRALC